MKPGDDVRHVTLRRAGAGATTAVAQHSLPFRSRDDCVVATL